MKTSDFNIVQLPEAWYHAIMAKPLRTSPQKISGEIPEGERNVTLFIEASTMWAKGHSEEEITAEIFRLNRERCNPPLPDSEIEASINFVISNYTQGKAPSDKNEAQAEKLLTLVYAEGAEFFRDELKEPYAIVPFENHKEIWPTKGSEFALWLQKLFCDATAKSISANALKQALGVLHGKAIFEGEMRSLSVRVAKHDNVRWYDLTNETWQTIKIFPNGWECCDEPPILFRRYSHQRAQVLPQRDGDIYKIFDHINVENNRTLFLCWMVSCFVSDIPHAILILYGKMGAAKTTTCKLLRSLIDPSALETMALETKPDALIVSLKENWLLPFDNVSNINEKTSNMLCQAVTGGAIQHRKLYSNGESYIFQFQRSIIINGIEIAAKQPDLLDRSILIELERLPEAKRKTATAVQIAFEADRPAILGGILDVLAKAMAIYPTVEQEIKGKLQRMGDFTQWGYAIGEALGGKGQEFLDQYEANRKAQNIEVIHSNPFATLVVAFMEEQDTWQGTATALLAELSKIAPEHEITAKSLPASNRVAKMLGEAEENLRNVGIDYEITRKTAESRKIILRKSNPPLPSSPSSKSQ